MHCHLIVSRKDQSNKKKLSPATNHRSTTKGAVKGGFDRKTLFQQAEAGFDKLFGYQRDMQETFTFCNTMKNGSIPEKLEMQETYLLNESKAANDSNPMKKENWNLHQAPSSTVGVLDEAANLASALGSLFSFDTQGDYDEGQIEYLKQHKKKKKRRNTQIFH
jgi:hypothetical protein